MKMPQIIIGARRGEFAIGNWPELDRWARCHVPIWHAASARAIDLGMTEDQAVRLIAWCVLGAYHEHLQASAAAAGVHEANPGNEALTQLRGQWEKVLLAVMRKQGLAEITLDATDFERAFPEGSAPTFAVIGRKELGPHGGFTLKIANSQAEAVAIVAQHQGRG